jgi:hypothetical protein
MLKTLDKKVRQMHLALDGLKNSNLSNLEYESYSSKGGYYWKLDFNQNKSDAELENTATLLITNIASIKDHLKVWCSDNNVKFEGEELINNNHEVALVHDLWNKDKHARLNRPPRSGINPVLVNLNQMLQVSSSDKKGSSASFSFDPVTGQQIINTTGGGTVNLIIDGDILDESNSTKIASFEKICESAAISWEKLLIDSGVQL